ncbi:uncharacterized protein A4U43_C07F1490 [Asparagus officinalis]|uniref:Uncharacterized protein n=1 Tax=Asparagus officinalis TaxID=4686 RepID=A0A5P1E8N5_ASPOF|nr:uncharacterized protein A4U43_C07F1490 [Asparagus officinalis]
MFQFCRGPVMRSTVAACSSGGWVGLIRPSELDNSSVRSSRCLVHALSPRGSYKLGLEHGMACFRWETSQSKVASSAVGSSQMLRI